MSSILKVSGLVKRYGEGTSPHLAVDDVSFTVERGQFVSIVGPSGCGKSTLLKCVSALASLTDGSVEVDGKEIKEPPDSMAAVFQDYSRSLYPWLTVRKNVELPLQARKVPRAERRARVEQALEMVGLAGAGGRRSYELSGGMQQRVAIARALAYRAGILLMDEPFASVDAQTRADLEELLVKVHEQSAVTVLFVTHDIDEAIFLADRVVVLSSPPATVRRVIDVELPRPRDQVRTKELAKYLDLRASVYELIRSQTAGPVV